jgi:hypothetical protein
MNKSPDHPRFADRVDTRDPGQNGLWSFAFGLAMLALGVLVTLVTPVSLVFRTVSRNYNEGWNAFWADAAVAGNGSLYASGESLITNNYPPLSFHLVGRIGQFVGDNVIAGRLVSLASFAVLILTASLWLRAVGTSRLVAVAAGTMLAAVFSRYAQGYIAMNDPQMLAHAFMLCGVAVLWHFDFSRPAVVSAALLTLLGGFTKHLLIPVPLAVTVWLAMYRRQSLAAWVACFAIGLPLGFWLTLRSYPHFMDQLLLERVYGSHRTISATLPVLKHVLPLLIVGTLPLIGMLRRRDPFRIEAPWVFVLLYVVLSLVIGALGSGGAGVNRNAFFDLLIASSLLAGLGLERLREAHGQWRFFRAPAASVVMLVLGASMAIESATAGPQTMRSLHERDDLERDTRTMVSLIGELGGGRAACETVALCYWAHEPFTLDFFGYGQKVRSSPASRESCDAMFERGEFPVVQVESSRLSEYSRLGPCTLAIGRYYTAVFHSRLGTLFVPKQSAGRR